MIQINKYIYIIIVRTAALIDRFCSETSCKQNSQGVKFGSIRINKCSEDEAVPITSKRLLAIRVSPAFKRRSGAACRASRGVSIRCHLRLCAFLRQEFHVTVLLDLRAFRAEVAVAHEAPV